MPITGLNHPLTGAYPRPVETPKWLIVLRDGKVVRNRDLATMRRFIHREFGDTTLRVTEHISRMLQDAEARLDDTDVYILENREGDELHFCRASFRHKRGYIASVEKGE